MKNKDSRAVSEKLWPLFKLRPFSLTLTLSRWEREQPLDTSLKLVTRGAESAGGFTKTLGAFLPLPAGEGRGEGERFTCAEQL